jgi:hypothetical protein
MTRAKAKLNGNPKYEVFLDDMELFNMVCDSEKVENMGEIFECGGWMVKWALDDCGRPDGVRILFFDNPKAMENYEESYE